jgi:hypothetical protein
MASIYGPFVLPAGGSWWHWFTQDDYYHDYNWLVANPFILLPVPRPRYSMPEWNVYAADHRVILERTGTPPNTWYRYYYNVLVANPTSQSQYYNIAVQKLS